MTLDIGIAVFAAIGAVHERRYGYRHLQPQTPATNLGPTPRNYPHWSGNSRGLRKN